MITDLVPVARFNFSEQLKALVIDGVASLESKRAYGRAIDIFTDWFIAEKPESGFTKATVQKFKAHLLFRNLAPSTVNLYLAAVKKLAVESSDNGYLPSEVCAAILRVPGVKRLGVRTGNWLTKRQAEELIESPGAKTLIAKRDTAILAVLLGTGLRRNELSSLRIDHIQMREARWVLVDIVGKGKRVRSVPMPSWAKAFIDSWTSAAQIESGKVFRRVNKGGNVGGASMSPQAVFDVVRKYSTLRKNPISAHDTRRTFAKSAHAGHAAVEQIQLCLGHASIATTEGYLGIRQNLSDAPCDHLGFRISVDND